MLLFFSFELLKKKKNLDTAQVHIEELTYIIEGYIYMKKILLRRPWCSYGLALGVEP